MYHLHVRHTVRDAGLQIRVPVLSAVISDGPSQRSLIQVRIVGWMDQGDGKLQNTCRQPLLGCLVRGYCKHLIFNPVVRVNVRMEDAGGSEGSDVGIQKDALANPRRYAISAIGRSQQFVEALNLGHGVASV